MTDQTERRMPLSAMILGAAGLLPIVLALIVRLAAGVDPETPLPGVVGALAMLYAALILSFLGGIWWGVALGRAAAELRTRLMVLSVAPALVAWMMVALSLRWPVAASVLLGLVIAATPLVDRRLAAYGLVPRWWTRLRLPLSLALGVLTIGLGLALA